jgi:hypothetical protein
MALYLNYQSTPKEDAFIYYCPFRDNLSSSQKDQNFTDVVFFIGN